MGVRLAHFALQCRGQQQRIAFRIHVKGHGGEFVSLRVGDVNVRKRGLAIDMILVDVPHHADDLGVRLDLVAAAKGKVHADGIAAGKEAFDHGFADNRDLRARGAVRLGEFASREQWYAQRGEIARAYGYIVDVLLVFGELDATFDGDV